MWCMNEDWRSYQMEATCVEYLDPTQIADESVTELQQISINSNVWSIHVELQQISIYSDIWSIQVNMDPIQISGGGLNVCGKLWTNSNKYPNKKDRSKQARKLRSYASSKLCPLTDWLTGVGSRATSVAKNTLVTSEWNSENPCKWTWHKLGFGLVVKLRLKY